MATVVSLFQINKLPAAWLALAVTVAMISSRLPILLTRARMVARSIRETISTS